jgi:hypothetical protein
MHWQGQRVLVTGAGGFIDSHLVERLGELGARMRALVRDNSRNDWGRLELLPAKIKTEIEVVLGDLTDPSPHPPHGPGQPGYLSSGRLDCHPLFLPYPGSLGGDQLRRHLEPLGGDSPSRGRAPGAHFHP